MNHRTTVILLRVAALVSLLYCLGHMSGLPWTPGKTDAAKAVVESMRGVQFEAMGVQRAYWDFYFGFGLITGLDLLVQSAVLWWLSGLARQHGVKLVPVLAIVLGGVALNAYLCYRYFFALPALFAVVIALLLAASIWTARRGDA